MRISNESRQASKCFENIAFSEIMNPCSLILAVGLSFMFTPAGRQAIYDYQMKDNPEKMVSQSFKNFITNNPKLIYLVEKNGGAVLEEKGKNTVILLFTSKNKVPVISPQLKNELAKCAVIKEIIPDKINYPESSKVAVYTLEVKIETTQSNY